jgi:hypothetical protein
VVKTALSMSALGQKRTLGQPQLMSALPQKQTLLSVIGMSALCQKQTLRGLIQSLRRHAQGRRAEYSIRAPWRRGC